MAEKSVIEKLEDAISDSKATVRELHEATKEMRAVLKECREVKVEIDQLINKDIEDRVAARITAEFQEALEAIADFQQRSYDTILRGFTEITDPLIDGIRLVETLAIEKGVVVTPAAFPTLPPVPEMRKTNGK